MLGFAVHQGVALPDATVAAVDGRKEGVTAILRARTDVKGDFLRSHVSSPCGLILPRRGFYEFPCYFCRMECNIRATPLFPARGDSLRVSTLGFLASIYSRRRSAIGKRPAGGGQRIWQNRKKDLFKA